MKTDLEWRKTVEDRGLYLRDSAGGDAAREFDEFIRAVQADARANTLREAYDICLEEQRRFDIIARDAPRSEEGRWAGNRALVAANSIVQCIMRLNALISGHMIASGEVPLGNNPAPEVK